MKLDQGAEAAGISGTGWLCGARPPERILPDNTHFMEKNVGWVLACHTQKCIMFQKNVPSKGLIRTLMGPLLCTGFLKKCKNYSDWSWTFPVLKSVSFGCGGSHI